ncbi:MAG TPA: hypothetical protein VKN14_03050, partial [Flavobacteriaceae bacterium]|nr:hypothetical protein [Flavobacteriaceae bacterium]
NFTYCSLLNLEYMPYVKGEGAVPVESVGNQENVDEEHIPYASHNLNTCISATESKVLKRQAGLSQ